MTLDTLNTLSDYPFGMIMPGRSSNPDEYRFGFNGQGKTDEISGIGNHNSALFWEYNTRLGRRWNVDPIKKPWQSDYACFSNTPIWKVDPDGDDDFFNANGSFSHSTKKGSRIFVQTAEGNVLLTQVNLNAVNTRQAVVNVVGYYANQVGITYQAKGSKENVGKGIVGLKASDKSSDINPAFTEGNNILINKKDGKIANDLSDFNNLKSALIHEKDHKDKGHGFADKLSDNFDHAEVYFTQISDPTFLNGTPEFQEATIRSMANYLKDASNNDKRQDMDIIDLIEKTNSAISKTGLRMQFIRTTMETAEIKVNGKKFEKK